MKKGADRKNTIYLFDWGNTLMMDDPRQTGPMYLWASVSLCKNARPALEILSQNHALYLATNAKDSDETDIRKALIRTGINDYITGIFCFRRLGVLKPSPEFFKAVLECLKCSPGDILMVGDDPKNDVTWAIENGARALLYDPSDRHRGSGFDSINDLLELCEL